jgi:hypothetical protein
LGLFARPDQDDDAPSTAASGAESAERLLLERLRALDVDNTTPRQALEILADLKTLSEEAQ